MGDYGKIALLAGGISEERKISLKSGEAVFRALRRRKQDVDFIDVKYNFVQKLKEIKARVAFLVLHGRFGEDGRVQSILEKLKIPYTGSGVRASRRALDKIASKNIFLKNGLPVPKHAVIEKNTDLDNVIKRINTPFVVKPQNEGSSIGLSIVWDKSKVKNALRKAFRYDDKVLIEEFIDGRELTVGVLADQTLPAIEIVTRNSIYDYSSKYRDENTRYIVPAPLPQSVSGKVKEYALRAHRLLGCRDLSRTDMRMDKGGNIYILEVNTIPGMTERSLLPKAAEACGISFDDLCTKLVELAYSRHANNQTSISNNQIITNDQIPISKN